VNRRNLTIAGIALLVIAAVSAGFYARAAAAATPGAIALAGDVRAELYTVRAPTVVYPTPDYSVGIPTAATATPKKPAAGAPTSASRLPAVSGFLSQMLVTEGSLVTTGQVLARLDTTMLELGVKSARAAADRASASLDVLDNTINKLVDARAKLIKARSQLIKARASLSATITVLARTRAGLETSIAAIQALIAQPGGPPPHVPPYPVLLAGLQAGLTQLNAGIAGARTGLATMNSGLAKIAKGLGQMDTALHQLRDARHLAAVNIEAQDVGVRLAEARRDAATITSPVSGVVTFARVAGTAVIVGAPLVRIDPDGPTLVDTYLTTEQLLQVSIGTPATVDFDSNPGGPLSGHIAVIGDDAVVPPTGFPTAIVHMTRAVKVTIELDSGDTAPPGTPVDVRIKTGTAG
jgi:HlyD family secretion protein